MSNATDGDSAADFFGLLTMVFIALKLTNAIAWSWWWVMAPIWGPIVIFFIVCAVTYILF